MKILLLGSSKPRIKAFLESGGDTVINAEYKLEVSLPILQSTDFIISYGYRHIIRKDVLDLFPQRVINLHISLLPWNRGADPNLWSFLEDTPKGVTIHLMDEGIDTGPVLAKREVEHEENDTLSSTYRRLSESMESLFIKVWPEIRGRRIKPNPQPDYGSFHSLADKEPFMHLLTEGWETPVRYLIGQALKEPSNGLI